MAEEKGLFAAKEEAIESKARTIAWTLILPVMLALLVTAVDTYFSVQIGLLAHPPVYDGIGYLIEAKSLFYRLKKIGFDPAFLISNLSSVGFNPLVILWRSLMVLNFLLLGEGEWQAYTVRFWPIFLLMLLISWVVKRRGCKTEMLTALAFTALLPTLSVGVRASAAQYLSNTIARNLDVGLQWYVADLRPDLLFSVLLLWAIVPLIECANTLSRRVWLISGASLGLAVLAKSSMLPALAFAFAFAATYVLVVNRHRLLATFSTGIWGLLPLAIFLTPWLKVGGPWWTFWYLWTTFTAQHSLYSDPNATLLSEASYYWRLFPIHMGNEGWVILFIGVTWFLLSLYRRKRHSDSRLFAYLGVSAILYVVVSSAPNKNYFVGLPFYLLLWVFSWINLTTISNMWAHRKRILSWLLILLLCTYSAIHLLCGFYALQAWPVERRLTIETHRQVVRQIAGDLRTCLSNDDCFMYVPAYGFPAALTYYMIDDSGNHPRHIGLDVTRSPDEFIQEYLTDCKIVLAYEEDIDEVARFIYVHPVTRPYFRAISEWVKNPCSSYRLIGTYHFKTESGQLTLNLYFKQFNNTLIVLREANAFNSPTALVHHSPSRADCYVVDYNRLVSWELCAGESLLRSHATA